MVVGAVVVVVVACVVVVVACVVVVVGAGRCRGGWPSRGRCGPVVVVARVVVVVGARVVVGATVVDDPGEVTEPVVVVEPWPTTGLPGRRRAGRSSRVGRVVLIPRVRVSIAEGNSAYAVLGPRAALMAGHDHLACELPAQGLGVAKGVHTPVPGRQPVALAARGRGDAHDAVVEGPAHRAVVVGVPHRHDLALGGDQPVALGVGGGGHAGHGRAEGARQLRRTNRHSPEAQHTSATRGEQIAVPRRGDGHANHGGAQVARPSRAIIASIAEREHAAVAAEQPVTPPVRVLATPTMGFAKALVAIDP